MKSYNQITKNDNDIKECVHHTKHVDEPKDNHGKSKGKAKPITSPQKPWISY